MHKNSVRIKPKAHALHAIHHIARHARLAQRLNGRSGHAFKVAMSNLGDDLSLKTVKLLKRHFKTVKVESARMKRKAVRYAKAQPYKTAGIVVAAFFCLRFLLRKPKNLLKD